MILKGNQRGGARDLALHLLKEENDHVELHELRGFMSDDLPSALKEVYIISKATQAKKFLYSLSLNPPANENVSTLDFEDAIARVEKKLNLVGQPRAIVFHEKNGRRHCHAVWSRIDARQMKAIPMQDDWPKLMGVTRELFIKHGWHMPPGLKDRRNRDPKNFTLAQWQQARRIGKDPRDIKQALQDCWGISDDRPSFEAALKEYGYRLAQGDQRGFVVLDHRCEIFSVSKKWIGVKAQEVQKKLGESVKLPSVVQTRIKIAKEMQGYLGDLKTTQNVAIGERVALINSQLKKLISQQKQERKHQQTIQNQRWKMEVTQRQTRFNKGLKGMMDRLTGKHRRLRKQNEQETYLASLRDRKEKDELIFVHIDQRQSLQARHERLTGFAKNRDKMIKGDIEQYRDIGEQKRDVFEHLRQNPRQRKSRGPSLER